MRNLAAWLIMVSLIGVSCKKNEPPRNSGELILSSELLQSGQTYAYYGFMYSSGKVETYLQTNTPPDLFVDANQFGDTIVPLFGSSNFEDAFYLSGQFETAAAAEDFFLSYDEVTVPDFEFSPLANEIQANQVWTQKTVAGNYVKLWVEEVLLRSGTTTDWFVEVRFKYQYQPDGTKTFSECDCAGL